jgi:hypothetical protein
MKLLIPIMLVLSCVQNTDAQGWRGIVPLHSTRTDVERLLGTPKGECRCHYEADGEIINVEYSKAPCIGYPSGWNVGADTVLELSVRWKQPREFLDLQIVESKFEKAGDDTFTTYYSSRLEGVKYTVSWDKKVEGVSYIPASKDSDLRCPCFPLKDESVPRSISFDEFPVRSIDDALARLDNYVIQLLPHKQWTGYLILYAGKRTAPKKALFYRRAMRRHLIQTRGLPAERLIMIDGGYMEDPYVELFMLTRGLSPPEARPTWVPCQKSFQRGEAVGPRRT